MLLPKADTTELAPSADARAQFRVLASSTACHNGVRDVRRSRPSSRSCLPDCGPCAAFPASFGGRAPWFRTRSLPRILLRTGPSAHRSDGDRRLWTRDTAPVFGHYRFSQWNPMRQM